MACGSALVFSSMIAACLLGQAGPLEKLDLPDAPPRLGPFAQLGREAEFVGPGVLTPIPEPSEAGAETGHTFHLPGDFQPHKTLVLVADKLAAEHPEVLAGIVAAAQGRTELVGLVSDAPGRDDVRRVLRQHGLPAESIRLVPVPSDTVWVRDFGPALVRVDGRAVAAFDLDYARRSGDHRRQRDDAAAAVLAGRLDIPVRRVPLELELGYVISNGGDLLVTTTQAYNVNIRRGYDAATVTRCLRQMFGCRTIAVLEPLRGEPTGHVDVFACFTAPGTIVLGQYRGSANPANAAVLDRNAAVLSSLRALGKPLRVVRVPMPRNDDGRWRTYTNVVFVNGVVLLPEYGGNEAEDDAAAVALFRRLLPGWQIVGIDTSGLIAGEGALRCVTLGVPKEE